MSWDGTSVTPPENPFSVTNAVYFCWGLTLGLSHESQQQELGKDVLNDVLNHALTDEFKMILAKTIRNLAFLRLAHIRHLNRKTREFLETRELLNSIGDIAFSKDSIPLKLVSFFAGGAWSLSDINPSRAGIDGVILFVLYGLLGIFIANILFNIGAYLYLHFKEDRLRTKQNEYYKDKYINDMTKTLYDYCDDVKVFMKKEYNYTKADTTIESDPLLIKSKVEAEEYIKDRVLPSGNIDWDIWVISTEKPTEGQPIEDESKSSRPVHTPSSEQY
jgi:hypothetical protein